MRHLLAAAIAVIAAPAFAQEVKVEDVSFLSRDGKTQVKGYLFKPADAPGRLPADSCGEAERFRGAPRRCGTVTNVQ